MLDILVRSVARAGGIEVPAHVRILESPPPRDSVIRRLVRMAARVRGRRPSAATAVLAHPANAV